MGQRLREVCRGGWCGREPDEEERRGGELALVEGSGRARLEAGTNCDDPMHDCSVVVSTFGELGKVLAGLRRREEEKGKGGEGEGGQLEVPSGKLNSSLALAHPAVVFTLGAWST